MYSKVVAGTIVLVAVAPSAFSAPVPGPAAEVHPELDARLTIPSGTIASLGKSLGKGLLTGGAVSGLLGLLGGDDNSSATRRDLEGRGALGTALGKLVGVGETSLKDAIKNAVIGGVASGVAVEGVNAVAGNQRRTSFPAGAVEGAAKAAEKGIGSVIGDGLADGVGSAVGGLAIGGILGKLFGGNSTKRDLEDLSDDEVNTLLEYVNEIQNSKRSLGSSIGKGLAGTAAGLAATDLTETAIEKIKGLLGDREIGLNDLD
ncbi:hypothetical protein MVEN_01420100 [Mycena venus]|uniref:Uncharacterized protein n=1 Tax=Mycena venus TaxID=2733690 RepID=A0A8H6XYN9_9AGAR|nr:hypothetical protein MVEN_01420100 [Mycena venus]